MKEFFLLKLLDPFKKIFKSLGIDYEIMRMILQVKLTMDGRRTSTVFNQNKKQEKNSYVSTLLYYMFLGLFNVFFILMGDFLLIQMSLLFGFILFMMTTSMITDFSSVMLDIKEKNIILTKPVNQKTINMAKFIHILYYLACLTLAISLASLIVSLFKYGFTFFILYLIVLILINLLIIFSTSFLYLLILKFFDGEKLKDMINYFQIILTIFITVGYQFIGRSMQFFNFENLTYNFKWWYYLLPPMWFSAPFEMIFNHQRDLNLIILSALALLLPIVAIIIYIKLIPSFERNLQKLNNAQSIDHNQRKHPIRQKLLNLICITREERIFYRFTKEMMKNEREFKMKVYPALGFAIIFPFIFLFNMTGLDHFSELKGTKFYLYIYFCTIMLPTITMVLKYSSNYKGAWIYKSLPIEDLSPVIKGSYKAFIIKLLLPVYLVESVIFLGLFGLHIIVDLLIVLLFMLVLIHICFNLMGKALPFSTSNENQDNQAGVMFLLMFVILIFVLIHLGLSYIPYGLYGYLTVLLIINFLLWKSGFKITWKDLD